MQIIRDYQAILNQFDFYGSYVTEVKWSEDLFDLILTVNYFHDMPKGCKNCDVLVILKDCDVALFNVSQDAKQDITADDRMAISYNAYSIESFNVTKENNHLKLIVGTTIKNHKWLEAKCRELWIEI